MKAVDIFLSKRQLTVAQLLLVAKADLAGIVDLRPDTGKLVQFVLAADAERRLVLGGGPTEVDTSLQTGVHLLVNRATELLHQKLICQICDTVDDDWSLRFN